MRPKTLFIITKSNWGGAQRYVYDLAVGITEKGYDAMVAFGGSGSLATRLLAAKIPTEVIDGLQRDAGFLKEVRAFFNILSAISRNQPHIVHLNSSKTGILGALAARLYNSSLLILNLVHPLPPQDRDTIRGYKPVRHPVTIVFTAHGWAFKEKRKFASKKIIEYLSWLTILLSHSTIVVSEEDKERVKNFSWLQSKIHLIHNGVSSFAFKNRSNARTALAEKTGITFTEESYLVGSIAELHRNKGLEYAVNALALLTRHLLQKNEHPENLFYIIIGAGEERPRLEKMIMESNLQNNVILTGEIENAPSLLKAFDTFLLPSLKEGLPYALLEAGSAGLPSVATNVGGIPEIIDDMRSGIIVRAKRPKEISEALNFLIEHKDKRKEFGVSLKKAIDTAYTLERMIKETTTLYSNH
ncbi:MAG: glycosyltransferase [Candidatus Taylorbacteria bacterium]|nr:glycosyltransferase [Candidatus Taylorbacteria bacterium]